MNRKAKAQAGKRDQQGEAGVRTAHLLEVDFFATARGRGSVTQRGHICAMNPFLLYVHTRLSTCIHMFKIYLHVNAGQRINYTLLLNK